MGAGRKTETLVLQKKNPPQWTYNCNPLSARNLRKKDLGSVIFGCKHSTFKECISKQLFGLPAPHFQYVQNVTQGMPLFLFNYSDRKLHGIFEAASAGQMNIDKYAWTFDGEGTTLFPAQVRVTVRMQCHPLAEDQYQPILAGNYLEHERTHIWFELDRSQSNKLISLFSACPVAPSVSVPYFTSNGGPPFSQAGISSTHQEKYSFRKANIDMHSVSSSYCERNHSGKQVLEAALGQDASEKQKNVTICAQGKTWSSLFKPHSVSVQKNKVEDSQKMALEAHISCQNQFDKLWESCSEGSPRGEDLPSEKPIAEGMPSRQQDSEDNLSQESCSEGSPHGEDVPSDKPTAEGMPSVQQDSEDNLAQESCSEGSPHGEDVPSEKPTEGMPCLQQDSEDNLTQESKLERASPRVVSDLGDHIELAEAPLEATIQDKDPMTPEPCSEGSNVSTMSGINDSKDNAAGVPSGLAEGNAKATSFADKMISEMKHLDLQVVVAKLIQTIEEMQSMQLSQTRRIQILEQELVESNRKAEELNYQCRTSGLSMSSLSMRHFKETHVDRYLQDSNHSILLVSGFDGSSWLPNLDSYSPSKDLMQSLEPMNFVRAYSCAVNLSSELYVLGGAYRATWYDTVESYNLRSHHWVSCPSLNRKKGSLAGASLSDKIFAIGGGNATGCFSEVEMLDLNIGKWIFTRPMVQKRFAPAAAQINGVLYVAGGYDGREYLKCMERFDPREHSWTRLKSMNTSRGCHSLTVLNEKLYAIGGYDGSQMVPTVEIYEPRVGSWTMSEPMKYARGYMGAVTLGNTIYAIGGMQENEQISDTVECYSEGEGWRLTDLKSVGKRCFFSAVVVSSDELRTM